MPASANQAFAEPNRLRTTRYDKVSSMLLALLILIGSMVMIMLIAWLSSHFFVPQTAVPVELADFEGDDGPPGGGQTPEPPNPEEIQEMEIEEPVVEEVLQDVAAVVKQIPKLDDPLIAHKKTTGMGFGHGEGRGRGDGKGDGSGGRGRRWEVHFNKGATLDVYAKQLDFFKIELAVLLPDGRVAYAYNLSKRKPDVRYEQADKESRYYLTWRKGTLEEADKQLLLKAGIPVGDYIILKFLPPKLEAELQAMEKNYAGVDPKNIRRTRFGVRSEGNGYAFYIVEQTYKN
jgi:hypothetical protein